MQIADRVQRIAASQSLAMAARAKAMKAAGVDVISMSLGEPDMDTPEHIRRAAQEAIDNGWTHYGPVAGIPSLREAIATAQNAQIAEYKNIQNTAYADINIEKKNTHSTPAMSDGPRGLERNHPQALTSKLAAPVDANTPNLLPDEQHVECLQKCVVPPYENAENIECGISFNASDVIVSVGAKMAIYNAIQTVINPGDEVVIPMPSWVSYTEMVKVAGGEVVAVKTKYENRYCLTPEELRAVLTDKTRMLILCSPNNPTGSVYSYEELKAIVEVLRNYPQVVVLSDEIYNALVYSDEENKNNKNTAYADINIENKNAESTVAERDLRVTTNQPAREQAPGQDACEFRTAGTDIQSPQDSLQKCVVPPYENDKNIVCSMAFFPELQDRLIIVNGVSKAYAMTGWRIGWLMSKNKAFIEACTRLQGQQVTCATMVAQKAAEAALTGSQECVAQMRQVFAERRELICRLAAEIPGFRFEKPQGAFYLFPDVSALMGKPTSNPSLKGRVLKNADDLAEYILNEAHVAVVSGSAFGCPECIRLSYAISTEEITEAMQRIKVAITRIVNKQK